MISQESFGKLVAVAEGRAPAEVVLQGGRIVDVLLGRIRDGLVIGLSGDRIAYLGPPAPGLVGPATEVVDLAGGYILPGLIDGHTHLDSVFQCAAFVEKALAFGNTTCVTEAAMMAHALGQAGVELFIKDAAALPMKLYFVSPSLVPTLPLCETSAGFDQTDVAGFLARPEVLGLGETYWNALFNGDQRPASFFALAQSLGKTIEGHAAGLRGRRLMAYRAAGVLSCHEATSTAEARERLDLGLAVMVREGLVRREMEQVLPGLSPAELASGLVMLVSDTADPAELISQGGLNLLLRKAVALGVDPLRAVQMLTINPARYFNLRLQGAIVPGNYADMAVVDDLTAFTCRQVWASGRRVAQDGRLTVDLPRFTYPDWTRRSIKLDSVRAEDLVITAPPGRVRVRVAALASETITRLEEIELTATDGKIKPIPGHDVLLMAHFSRRGDRPPALGLVKGVGLQTGAVALSLIWDTNNVLGVGADEADLAVAVNRLTELGGGLVVAAQGRVLAELPLPVAGIISPEPLERIVADYQAVETALAGLGCRINRPFLTLQTIPFTGLPFLRLTDRGLVDVKAGRLIPVAEPL